MSDRETQVTAQGTDARHDRALIKSAIGAYALALLLGIGITLYLIPLHMIFASDALTHPVVGGDATVHVIGQRYYLADSWRWPLLTAKSLVPPEGTNIAFMDSIPLIALPMKLLRHFLPPGFHSIFLWLAFCVVAQPVAAVFAIRSAGERRIIPNLTVALIAVSMPTFLFRFGHSSLCSHFLILVALGLYFRITRHAEWKLIVMAGALMIISLLVNPYLMYMVIALLAAAPLSLLLRSDRAWIKVGSGVVTAVAITGAIALLLGYSHALPMSGFGYYSMNVLSPIYPFGSSLIRGVSVQMDATGGQYEGYQYLGIGVILLLLIADWCLGPHDRITLLRGHGGIVLACLGMIALSLSTRIYAGHHLLFDLRTPQWLLQLRTTGRFFWPVAYTLIVAVTAIVCRFSSPRVSVAVLLLTATLQFIDAGAMRRRMHDELREPQQWVLDTTVLRPLLRKDIKLTVWPKFLCGADHQSPAFLQLFLLASERAIPVNTMYVGRLTKPPDCSASQVPAELGPNELLVFIPPAPMAMVMSVPDWNHICRQVGVLSVCAQDLRDRADLPIPAFQTITLEKAFSTAQNGLGVPELASGWSIPEPWGVWSEGPVARLIVRFAEPVDKPLTLTVQARGLGVHPDTSQRVSVVANGSAVATWDLDENSFGKYKARIPAPSNPAQPIVIEFHIQHPISPRQDGFGPDDRKLGFALSEFRFDRSLK